MSFPPWAWFSFGAVLLTLLALDMFSHRDGRCDSTRAAITWTAVWIGVGVGFSGFVVAACCKEAAVDYLAAYFIEKSLSGVRGREDPRLALGPRPRARVHRVRARLDQRRRVVERASSGERAKRCPGTGAPPRVRDAAGRRTMIAARRRG